MNLLKTSHIKYYIAIVLATLILSLLTACSCGSNPAIENSNDSTNNANSNTSVNNTTNGNKKAASLDDFKSSCIKHGYENKLEPIMSGDNKLIGYSISVNSEKEQPTNLIFYDLKTEENLSHIYPKEETSITDLAHKDNIISDFREGSEFNYSYKKATNFKVKGTDSIPTMDMPLKLAYCIKVDTTCMYAVLYEKEYNDLNAVIDDIGYSVSS